MKRLLASAAGALFALMCMAPTPGDVGGCGTTPAELNVEDYAFARKSQDCERCRDCALTTHRCSRACDPNQPPDTALPTTCRPLVHDGEVCIRALHAASCGTYATYVSDTSPSQPSECDFCQIEPTAPLPGFSFDSGQASIDAGGE